MITTILNHDIEIIDIKNFKEYFIDNCEKFTTIAKKSFLKAVDIPPSYFLEQPETTKSTLLDNKEDRINTMSKYVGKCIVVVWKDGIIRNACRMNTVDADDMLDRLSTIDDVENIIWSKEFYKDGYLQGYIPVGKLNKDKYTSCMVIDFPIMLNKPTVLHNAFIKLPNEKSIVNEDLFYYVSSEDVDFNQYQHVGLAIEEVYQSISDNSEVKSMDDNENITILRETDEVLCELVEAKIIPSNLLAGISGFIGSNYEGIELSVNLLSNVILSYEANLKSIKQVTNLRGVYTFLNTHFSQPEIPLEQLIA